MGGLALYDGDRYVCHLWDRDSFNEYIDPDDRQFRRKGVDGFEMRIAIRIEKNMGLDKMDLERIKEMPELEVRRIRPLFCRVNC